VTLFWEWLPSSSLIHFFPKNIDAITLIECPSSSPPPSRLISIAAGNVPSSPSRALRDYNPFAFFPLPIATVQPTPLLVVWFRKNTGIFSSVIFSTVYVPFAEGSVPNTPRYRFVKPHRPEDPSVFFFFYSSAPELFFVTPSLLRGQSRRRPKGTDLWLK